MDSTPFEPFRVPDSLLAAAYESVTPQQRAWLKTTQALVQSVYGEAPTVSDCRCSPAGSGFTHGVRTAPVPWTLVFVGGNFAAPCRLSAALMAARLAGVERILVFFAAAPGKVCPAVFAACELAGVEHLYDLSSRSPSPENLSPFDVLLTLPPAQGRVLTFGSQHGLPLPFPAWHDTPPRLAVARGAEISEAELRSFHPDAVFVSPDDPHPADVIYSDDAFPDACFPDASPVRLCLGSGLEGTWLHAGLTPHFFQHSTLRLTRTDRPL